MKTFSVPPQSFRAIRLASSLRGGSSVVPSVHLPSAVWVKAGSSANVASPGRFQAPLHMMTSEVSVQTMIVSMNGSRPATIPSRTGSLVLAAEWAMGEEPCPASLENKARFMPQRKA